ncbi:hypothetical protein BU26DRAFT_506051 [Trematosphaeria pertusa]|uniref:Uncharacterized protein n=1 Tax=Trematosphaeria pertusa TaxID=390896 RepID=A0A6A6IDN4_9PLEO|nr:uncharacterized protein BU26DRAFT_506051 [Trematosphaeria pertusa]KAF2248329.1 hypothetical protein BU26DRAFT_506051 [Trematosphaeria pertusa]
MTLFLPHAAPSTQAIVLSLLSSLKQASMDILSGGTEASFPPGGRTEARTSRSNDEGLEWDIYQTRFATMVRTLFNVALGKSPVRPELSCLLRAYSKSPLLLGIDIIRLKNLPTLQLATVVTHVNQHPIVILFGLLLPSSHRTVVASVLHSLSNRRIGVKNAGPVDVPLDNLLRFFVLPPRRHLVTVLVDNPEGIPRASLRLDIRNLLLHDGFQHYARRGCVVSSAEDARLSMLSLECFR